MADEKINIKEYILGFVIGGLIGFFLSPEVLMPNIEQSFDVDAIIDQSNAKNPTAQWYYHVQPEKKYLWSHWGLDPGWARHPESWSYFDAGAADLDHNFNLSEYKGLSFKCKNNIENQKIEFNLFTRVSNSSTNENGNYQYYDNNISISTNWENIELLFTNTTITPWTKKWYPAAPEEPNLGDVYGFGFAIKTKKPVENKIWIERMNLIRNDGSKEPLSNFSTFNFSINEVEGVWTAGWGHL